MGQITCKHCGLQIKKNPRIKGVQRYCGSRICQQARKNRWELDRIKQLSSYRTERIASKLKWRKQRPGHVYQRAYRESHPEYVETNRQKQLERNHKGRLGKPAAQIVKTDALSSASLVSGGLYELIPYKSPNSGKIVKTDALIVQLNDIQGIKAPVRINST